MKGLSEKIISFAQELIQIPSQNGIDGEREVAQLVFSRLQELGFQPELIGDEERPSVICYIKKREGAKTIWFEACTDTVPSGSLALWDDDPFSGKLEDGKLYGLGAADCKVAVATFVYLAKKLYEDPEFDANIFLGFDADEQAGWFSGARDVLRHAPEADVCILGYQGMDDSLIGARGWSRFTIQTNGKAQHTGSRFPMGVNAIHAMGKVIFALQGLKLKASKDPYFWFGPSMNVVQIDGGTAINVVPENCTIEIDVRLIPGQTEEDVERQIKKLLQKVSKKGRVFQYDISVNQGELAYLSDPKHPFVKILKKTAESVLGREVPLVASGYGCVGNILQTSRMPIINGFGCPGGNLNGANEWVDVSKLPTVIEIYTKTLKKYLQK